MIDALWRKYRRQFVMVALIAMPGCILALIGLIYWAAQDSYVDYERVKACLERHQHQVIDGWQHRDMFLEDFGWQFRTADGRELRIDVYDWNPQRNCSHRAAGVQLRNKMMGPGPYLSFDHPDLVKALDGKQLKTMGDMLEHLDELLIWVEENPVFVVEPKEVERNSDNYLNLIMNPEW